MSNLSSQETITIPSLPLAVYQEIAAHLQQLDGIEVEILPQSSTNFDYFKSQVEGLLLRYPADFPQEDQERLEEILSYYQQHYGQWERQAMSN